MRPTPWPTLGRTACIYRVCALYSAHGNYRLSVPVSVVRSHHRRCGGTVRTGAVLQSVWVRSEEAIASGAVVSVPVPGLRDPDQFTRRALSADPPLLRLWPQSGVREHAEGHRPRTGRGCPQAAIRSAPDTLPIPVQALRQVGHGTAGPWWSLSALRALPVGVRAGEAVARQIRNYAGREGAVGRWSLRHLRRRQETRRGSRPQYERGARDSLLLLQLDHRVRVRGPSAIAGRCRLRREAPR